MSSTSIIEVKDVIKDYPLGKLTVRALHGIDLVVERGEFTTIAGPSGSGKTTLLNLIGCVDVPTAGSVSFDGVLTSSLSDKDLTALRLEKLGFIFQSFNLVPVLSVFQNVELPLLLQGKFTDAERKQRVEAIIERVGLAKYLKHRPNELSGGQRQRVAIARALVSRPKLVLADEPTANLDSATGNSILELMKELNVQEHTTFIFSTHDHKVMEMASRIVRVQDGRIVDDGRAGKAASTTTSAAAAH
ncbi:MAG TPA: ABC transporter ATP-binding protein [Myxococcota bacterium]